MRRVVCLLTLALGVGGALVAGASRSDAASPAPSFSARLTDDGSCHFTATAGWSHSKVTEVDFRWSFGFGSWEDVVTSFRGPRAADTFTAGMTDTAREWSVTADFYVGGTLVGSASSSDTAACALLL